MAEFLVCIRRTYHTYHPGTLTVKVFPITRRTPKRAYVDFALDGAGTAEGAYMTSGYRGSKLGPWIDLDGRYSATIVKSEEAARALADEVVALWTVERPIAEATLRPIREAIEAGKEADREVRNELERKIAVVILKHREVADAPTPPA